MNEFVYLCGSVYRCFDVNDWLFEDFKDLIEHQTTVQGVEFTVSPPILGPDPSVRVNALWNGVDYVPEVRLYPGYLYYLDPHSTWDAANGTPTRDPIAMLPSGGSVNSAEGYVRLVRRYDQSWGAVVPTSNVFTYDGRKLPR